MKTEQVNGTGTAGKAAPVLLSVNPLVVAPSLTNPRKVFRPEAMEELKRSIKEQGVAQPIVVRPAPWYFVDEGRRDAKGGPVSFWRILDRRCVENGGFKKGLAKEKQEEMLREYPTLAEAKLALTHYEVVCGERRWRACRELGIGVPALVRELTDAAAEELQQIENLQREDLSALEEGEGFAALIATGRHTVESLVQRTGKSRAHVYSRLKLVSLPVAVKELVKAGKLNGSIADLVARIPGEKNQEKASKIILEGERSWDKEPMSYREAKEYVEEHFTLDLAKAPFDRKDKGLVVNAGACAECPKRTGNCRDLYPDIKSPDVCTDCDCYVAKVKACAAKQTLELKTKGIELIKPEVAKLVWPYGSSGEMGYRSAYAYPEQKCPQDPKGRTYRKLVMELGIEAGAKAKAKGKSAGIEAPRLWAGIDPRGVVQQLVKKEEVAKALQASGVKLKATAYDQSSPENERWKKQQAKQRAEEKERHRECDAINGAIVAAVGNRATMPKEFWPLLAEEMQGMAGFYVMQGIARRRQWEKDPKASYGDHYGKHVREMNTAQAVGLLAELCISRDEDAQNAMAKMFGVEVKKVVAALKAKGESKGAKKGGKR